jgi:hypothetical protein
MRFTKAKSALVGLSLIFSAKSTTETLVSNAGNLQELP